MSREGVSGVVDFVATYNNQSGLFLVLGSGVADTVGGLCLIGNFRIHIQGRIDKSLSQLPAVHVEGVEPIPPRHFSQSDKSACLCSPLEEEEYLKPGTDFQLFLEQLVIPFLYGQLFYTAHGRWPWGDYMHGSTGLLESYSKVNDPSKAEECLQKLLLDRNAWPKIKSAFIQKADIKSHAQCFCEKGDKIRRCHPEALKGIQKLRQDIKAQGISIPQT